MYSKMNNNGEHCLHEIDEDDNEDSNCGYESWSEVSSTGEDIDDDDDVFHPYYVR